MSGNRIITYDLKDDVIKTVADFIDANFIKKGKDLSKIGIIFGGERPSLFIKRELSRRVKKAYISPRFFGMDAFIDYIVRKNVNISKISEMDACHTIYTIAKQIAPMLVHERRFSEFLPWSREIMLFIDQLDMDEVSDKATRFIQEGADIGYDVPESVNALLEYIISIRNAYHAFMSEHKQYARGFRYLEASRIIKEIECDEFDALIFCNIFFLHQTERKILKILYDKGKTYLFFYGSQNEWPILADTASVFKCKIEPHTKDLYVKKEPKVSFYSGFDIHSQTSIAHKLIQNIKEPEETVLVLPDSDNIIPLLSEITSDVEDFNVSMGYPLKRSSLYSLLELIFKAQSTRRHGVYYVRDYLQVIRHPLIKNLYIFKNNAVTRVTVHKVEEVLLGIEPTDLGGSLFISLDKIVRCHDLFNIVGSTLKQMGYEVPSRDEFIDIIKEIHTFAFSIWENINSFIYFNEAMEKFLDMLIKSSYLKNYPLNLSITRQIFSILDEFAIATYKEETFDQEEIFELFKKYLEGKRISFKGTPLKGLQILGRLETRSLNFKNVIIMDVNEGIFPHVHVITPLIPRDIMIALGLRMIEREDEIQRYHFMRLINASENVCLIYDIGKDKERSRFIEEIIWQKEKKLKRLGVCPINKGSYNIKIKIEQKVINKQPYIVDFIKNKFVFSASSLNTYIKCPVRFYYQYMLHIEEKEDLFDEPEGKDIGNFIHTFLENIFKEYINKKPRIDRKFKDRFLKIFNEKFNTDFAKKMRADSFMVKQIMEYRLRQFLENEERRDVDAVLGVEKVYQGTIKVGKENIKIIAKVDRIDKKSDKVFVIDYKTGTNIEMPVTSNKLSTVDRYNRDLAKSYIRSFQIPLYIYFVQREYPKNCIDAALYNLRNTELIKFSEKVMEEYPYKKTMEHTMIALKDIIAEIINDNIPFIPTRDNSNYCLNCPFKALCI